MINDYKYHYVYCIYNHVDLKTYVGAHSDRDSLEGYSGSCKALNEDIERLGPEHFHFEILRQFDTREEAFAWEAGIVNKEFVKNPNTYNQMLGGFGVNVTYPTEETIRKRSEAQKGRVFSDETRRKISEGNRGVSRGKGVKKSDEHRKRISEALCGENNPGYGKPAWNRGKKDPKMSIARQGAGNPQAKPCVVKGIEFPTRKAAAEHFKCSPNTVAKWMKQGLAYYK